ncbi:hypothetical protein FHT86_006067 [Rhizobium sp. BK313]|nr:hypothetical protein [Rhizobium sp. BK313]
MNMVSTPGLVTYKQIYAKSDSSATRNGCGLALFLFVMTMYRNRHNAVQKQT